MRKKHEEAVEAFVEVRVLLRFEELDAEICGACEQYYAKTGMKAYT